MFYVCLQDRELSFLEHVHSGISNEIKCFCDGVKNIFPFFAGRSLKSLMPLHRCK